MESLRKQSGADAPVRRPTPSSAHCAGDQAGPGRNLIAELSELTRQMADTDPATDSFGEMLEQRGELMQQLCGRLRDPGDPRLELIERDGAALHFRLESRRRVLREEIISLERAAAVVDGVKSTLAAPQPGVNLIA